MNAPSPDLHGSAPDTSAVAVLLVDVINPLDFPEADDLLEFALPMADRLAALKRRARAAGVPVVYANDNFGRWRSDLAAVVERCREPGCKGRAAGREAAARSRTTISSSSRSTPRSSPPRSTRCSATSACGRSSIGGFAGNICVLFTANDAYMRDLRLVVPADAVASNTAAENAGALDQIRKVLKADVRPTADWTEAELRRLKAG